MDLAAVGAGLNSQDFLRFERAVTDYWRYSVTATVASGSTEMQRILLARSLVSVP